MKLQIKECTIPNTSKKFSELSIKGFNTIYKDDDNRMYIYYEQEEFKKILNPDIAAHKCILNTIIPTMEGLENGKLVRLRYLDNKAISFMNVNYGKRKGYFVSYTYNVEKANTNIDIIDNIKINNDDGKILSYKLLNDLSEQIVEYKNIEGAEVFYTKKYEDNKRITSIYVPLKIAENILQQFNKECYRNNVDHYLIQQEKGIGDMTGSYKIFIHPVRLSKTISASRYIYNARKKLCIEDGESLKYVYNIGKKYCIEENDKNHENSINLRKFLGINKIEKYYKEEIASEDSKQNVLNQVFKPRSLNIQAPEVETINLA